jgi:hypothetical protein
MALRVLTDASPRFPKEGPPLLARVTSTAHSEPYALISSADRTNQSEMGGDELTGKDFSQLKNEPARTKLERISQIFTVVVRIPQGMYYVVRVLYALNILG